MTSTSQLSIVQRLQADQPAFHMGGNARWDSLPDTLGAIHSSVKPGDVTIETGVGASTVVFAERGASHTAVSPDPDEHKLVRDYCRQIGVDDSRIQFIVGLSDDVLPSHLSHDRTLDVAFIDGAHSFPFPELDWYYITRSLKVGGQLLMDDITISAVADVFQHMSLESNWRLDGVFDDRAASFRLLAEPMPEEWSMQPYNKRYPDFRFAAPQKRLRLESAHRIQQAGRGLARRYPILRRLRSSR
ncbi:MAG TPA: class I SAM-dependent methyltransferase [Solirubrobacteraceae bacterium]|jgi:hypothetical protein|nr:class I SAM-dependent methyltransferase [Solirubrobacteraceae bacterium]